MYAANMEGGVRARYYAATYMSYLPAAAMSLGFWLASLRLFLDVVAGIYSYAACARASSAPSLKTQVQKSERRHKTQLPPRRTQGACK